MKKVIWSISGVFLIILGAYLMFHPLIALNSIFSMLGAVILAQGVTQMLDISSYEEDEKERKFFGLFSAILSIVLGVLMMFSQLNLVLSAVLPAVFGLWVVIKGLFQCIRAIYLRQLTIDVWSTFLCFGIINFLIGILMLSNPFIPIFTIAFSLGLSLIMIGMSAIVIEF